MDCMHPPPPPRSARPQALAGTEHASACARRGWKRLVGPPLASSRYAGPTPPPPQPGMWGGRAGPAPTAQLEGCKGGVWIAGQTRWLLVRLEMRYTSLSSFHRMRSKAPGCLHPQASLRRLQGRPARKKAQSTATGSCNMIWLYCTVQYKYVQYHPRGGSWRPAPSPRGGGARHRPAHPRLPACPGGGAPPPRALPPASCPGGRV